ncbi:MAG: hypothetical protein ISR82_07815 [Candidatus Marinimicrobia bacterium]|nr:hypothetical protein [Candidatus Neomarinimicrobiota bacterium]MBL7011114.1 hypothetical protein [Candidatus Neomarinimicrobiota bacterium]MBL7030133.1 hypothetical protein [Candidatus Neomarinimicrobiota bacterium]
MSNRPLTVKLIRKNIYISLLALFLFSSCSSPKAIRIHNISDRDFDDVTVAGEPLGSIPAGSTSEYVNVKLPFCYAIIKMHIDGTYINGQTLNLWANRFTHEIDIIDVEKGWLSIDVVRE